MARRIVNTLGASNLSEKERSENDYYGTNPESVKSLLKNETFNKENIWEPCAGHHLLSNVLKDSGYIVKESDICEYDGYEHALIDFLELDESIIKYNGDIITNPPYNLSNKFVVKALNLVEPGCKVAMFLRTLFLEGQTRYNSIFKENPPKTVYVFSRRQVCSKNDDFTEGSAVAYAWFVWEKGFKGDPIIKWITD